MRTRYLTVIKNEDGLNDYEAGMEKSANFVTYELPDEEFEFLTQKEVWAKINKECDLLIDDYESEMIANEHLQKCETIVAPLKDSAACFYKTVAESLKCNIALALDF